MGSDGTIADIALHVTHGFLSRPVVDGPVGRVYCARRASAAEEIRVSLDISTRRVLVTGGSGFLGRRVVAALAGRGNSQPFVPRRANTISSIEKPFNDCYVMHVQR
jgi:hypothetical protein